MSVFVRNVMKKIKIGHVLSSAAKLKKPTQFFTAFRLLIMKKKLLTAIFILMSVLSMPLLVLMVNKQQSTVATSIKANYENIAFIGAEGFGATATGGRGGTVIKVTNLEDSGPGSLREAIAFTGPRIIVFQIAGNIHLQSDLTIEQGNGNVTIAGQTAPGQGITLTNGTLDIRGDNVIVRYIRNRVGPNTSDPGNGDGIRIIGADRVIVDHCSFSWSTDENIGGLTEAKNVTIQWSIISEGLYNSTHPNGAHSKAFLTNLQNWNVSIHHNLLAHNDDRNPLVSSADPFEFVNNVVYDYLIGGLAAAGEPTYSTKIDFIKNYYVAGANTSTSPNFKSMRNYGGPGSVNYYVEGNIDIHRYDDSLPQELSVDGVDAMVDSPFVTNSTISTTSAADALEMVLQSAGSNWNGRDSADERIIFEVRNLNGGYVDDPSQVGGLPQLKTEKMWQDNDFDGMNDAWEKINGLNISVNDSGADPDEDGFANIEEFINDTPPLNLLSWQQLKWNEVVAQPIWDIRNGKYSSQNVDATSYNSVVLAEKQILNNMHMNRNISGWQHSLFEVPGIPEPTVMWLKAENITGLVDGQPVNLWPDSSVAGRNATTTTDPVNWPTYSSSGANGLPSVVWDGDLDYMQFPEFSTVSTDEFEMFYVIKPSAGYGGIIGTDPSYLWQFSEYYLGVADDDRTSQTLPHFIPDTNWHVHNVYLQNSQIFRFLDGLTTGASDPVFNQFTFKFLGARGAGGSSFNGQFAELIIYDRVLTQDERLRVENYLANKYDLPSNLGTTLEYDETKSFETNLRSASAKLTTGAYSAVLSQKANIEDSRTYKMEAYVNLGGTDVNAENAQLYLGNGPISTNYQNMDQDGWFKLTGVVTGPIVNTDAGVLISPGLTANIDRVGISAYDELGTLTSSVFNSSAMALDKSMASFASNAPLGTSVQVKIRSSNNVDMAGAPEFSTCSPVNTKKPLTNNNCVTLGHDYLQYQLILTTNSATLTPVFKGFKAMQR